MASRPQFLLLAAGLLAALTWPASSSAQIRTVWATHEGLGLRRDDPVDVARMRNVVWDGHRVSLLAARNEIVAFQVLVEAGDRGVQGLTLSLTELRSSAGPAIRYGAPQTDPTLTRDRPIQLFAVHYMHVTEESHADWVWKPGSAGAPRDTLGWKPVQLVPEQARAGRGGFPLSIRPHERQAFVVEIYTGRDRPAGTYSGSIVVADGGRHVSLPVTLELLDFALPDSPSLPVMVYYESSQPRLYQGRDLDEAYDRFAHRYRIELVHTYDEQSVQRQMARFDGSASTREQGYEGPGEGVGCRIVPASFYGPGVFATQEGWPRADSWVGLLTRLVPKALSFVYLPDESTPDRFAEVRRIAEQVHANPGPGHSLPTLVTRRIEPALAGAIDMWVVPPQELDLAAAAAEQRAGRRVWFYNHGRPNGPALVIDAPPTDGRVVGWAAFKHHLDGYFFWHGVHWQHNSQKQGERRQSVWANPIAFDNRGQPNKADFGFINGDGVLMYPGEDVLHPDEDRGIAGPVGTLQLANLRRGLQDYEYLVIARRLGLESLVDEIVAAVVPRVFSDAGDRVGFAEDGDAFEQARRRLGRAIAARNSKQSSIERK